MASDLFDLSGKTVLVTGGNGGLGLGFARGAARQGADLVLWGRNAGKNATAAEELGAFGTKVRTLAIDVASEDAVVKGMAQAAKECGRLDCVIANAGISTSSPSFVDLDSVTYHDLLDVNLHGAFYTLREAARHMVERAKAGDPGGSLIVCGSLSVFMGVPGKAHYGAAKGALAAMMKAMAVDLGKYGIRVNMIAPGYIKTDLGGDARATANIEAERAFAARTPIPRLGAPEDFEGIVAYLASDASSFHTGDIIVIDGGWLVNIF